MPRDSSNTSSIAVRISSKMYFKNCPIMCIGNEFEKLTLLWERSKKRKLGYKSNN